MIYLVVFEGLHESKHFPIGYDWTEAARTVQHYNARKKHAIIVTEAELQVLRG